jgi:hypothetical protein
VWNLPAPCGSDAFSRKEHPFDFFFALAIHYASQSAGNPKTRLTKASRFSLNVSPRVQPFLLPLGRTSKVCTAIRLRCSLKLLAWEPASTRGVERLRVTTEAAMGRHSVAACAAAAVALATCVDAGAPAFAVVRDAGVQGGGALRSGAGSKGGIAPKMVAGPQDYLTTLGAGKGAHAHWAAPSSGEDSRDPAAEGAARFYSLERIAKAKAFLEDLTKGVVDPTLLAQDAELVGASPGTALHGFSLDAHDPNRVWFHARSPSSQVVERSRQAPRL